MQKRFGLEGLSRERTAPCTRHADGASVELIAGLGRAWPSTGKLKADGIDQSVALGSSWAHLVAQMIHVAVGVETKDALASPAGRDDPIPRSPLG